MGVPAAKPVFTCTAFKCPTRLLLFDALTVACLALLSLLDHFLLIQERVILDEAANRTPEMTECAKNMYVALWDSLAPRAQSAILEHKNNFKTDGPVLLYYVLRK